MTADRSEFEHLRNLPDGSLTRTEVAILLDTIRAERRKEREARRAVGWVVAACGGQVTVPDVVMVADYDLMAHDHTLGGRTFIASLSGRSQTDV